MDATSDEETWYDVRVIADDEDVTVYRAERDSGDEMVEMLSAAAEYEYTPYGDTYLAHGSDQAFRYTGKPYESRTGLYYFPYRFYNPTTARWLTCQRKRFTNRESRDPLGMVDGPNVYAYVACDPVNGYDPLGLYRPPWHCKSRKGCWCPWGYRDSIWRDTLGRVWCCKRINWTKCDKCWDDFFDEHEACDGVDFCERAVQAKFMKCREKHCPY